MAAAPLTHIGKLAVAQFMRRHWQRRPLLVRNALPGFATPLDARALFALAARDDVESRLVTAFDGWRLEHGPIARRRIPPARREAWTLLVQGVDQHDDRAADLLERFRFIPDARLDDLMISFASEGGGVGPHIDDYDVFLLQGQGRRRWRIGQGNREDLVPGLPLKVLRRFKVEQEWILDPGDLLYLPPGVAHEGTAVDGPCTTCSIGFRAPAWRELTEPWLDHLSRVTRPAGRYGDRGALPTHKPGQLPRTFIDAAFTALARRRPTRADARDTLLVFLTEPKPNVVFDRPRVALSAAQLRAQARHAGLRLDRRSRMLYSGMSIALNGELHPSQANHRILMHALADQRSLAPAQLAGLDAATWRALADWHAAGWLHCP
jgi:50S ribosomal protein L16 3-hydroxylase